MSKTDQPLEKGWNTYTIFENHLAKIYYRLGGSGEGPLKVFALQNRQCSEEPSAHAVQGVAD